MIVAPISFFSQNVNVPVQQQWCMYKYKFDTHKDVYAFICAVFIQSTLVISTSIISNNRLSRRENLVLVLTQKSKIRLQNIVEKRKNCS